MIPSHTFDLPGATDSHDFEMSRSRWKTTRILLFDWWPLVPTQSSSEEGAEAEGMRCVVLMILRSPPAVLTPSRIAKAGGIRSSRRQEMAHGWSEASAVAPSAEATRNMFKSTSRADVHSSVVGGVPRARSVRPVGVSILSFRHYSRKVSETKFE